MTEVQHLKKDVITTFKLSGFTIRSEPALFLAGQLLPLPQGDREEWLQSITGHIQNQGLTNPIVEKAHLDLAIRDCNRTGLDDNETVFSVINAFDVPSFVYNADRKKYIFDTSRRSFLPDASQKAAYMKARYTMLWQRTIRHELFAPTVSGTTSRAKKFHLRSIEQLLSASYMAEVVVLGLLTQLTEGKFYIEDPTGIVPLDLTKAQYHSGLFCEGCFVLVEGCFEDLKLNVAGLGFPPPELATSSRAYFGTLNTWGGAGKTLLKHSARLMEIERLNTENTIVFLSDCWLDHPMVMDKLKILFAGYNDCPPTAIVLMGPFIKASECPALLKTKLAALADVLAPFDLLRTETDFVLVPSIDDPTAANILPRPPLPEALCGDFRKRVPRTVLATNPCRLQYCTQQIVVCRADLVTKFCRNTIHFPSSGNLEEHFARTLICQGTLTPLSPIALPTFWQYDAALTLYPLPDLVVIGDPSQGFQTTQQGCTILNTGSFPKSKFAFKVYIPSSRTIEDSFIPDDDDAS